MASETWSQSLSGWPSLTDSEVKRKVSISRLGKRIRCVSDPPHFTTKD
jgi:hypothetical protein